VLALVYGLNSGTLDSARFEDECRSLLGPDVYFLFTVDKLVAALHKQLVAVVADEKTQDVLRLVRELAAKDGAYEPLDLARCYNTAAQQLILEGQCTRVRFLPGQLEVPGVALHRLEPLPVPSGAIVEPRRRAVSPWKNPPRLGISLADEPPYSVLPADDNSIVVPCPIEIEAKGELSLAATAELGSTAKPAQHEPRLALPFFRAAKATATPAVARAMQAFQDQHEDKKGKEQAWFSNLLLGDRTAAAAQAPELTPPPAGAPATPDGDTDMKDDE
jgi:hypothetical protein